jgi:phosphoribosylamine--glycine ligase
MKILIVGNGGREHALAWVCRRAAGVAEVLVAPGNAGTATEPGVRNVPVAATDVAGLVALARAEGVALTIIGPEAPLVAGVVDAFQAAGLKCFGPSKACAQLEGSKAFTKEFLRRHGIPTAAYRSFTRDTFDAAWLRAQRAPLVVKASGLAAGKGVVIAATVDEALATVQEMFAGRFGDAGDTVVVEEFLEGEEASFIVMADGRTALPFASSQDHKRIGDGDTGPNTGGMGAYSPAEVVTPALLERIDREIVRPSVNAIADEGLDYCGTLFIGIMLCPEAGDAATPPRSAPKVIEYNARFGDPETQVVLPRLQTDLLALLWAATRRKLAGFQLEVRPDYALCVVIAAKGYPEAFARGDPITLPHASELLPQTFIFHAGTAKNAAGQIVTNGGRVLGVTALAPTLRVAAARAYATCEIIECASKYFRRDIGARQLKRQ